LNLLFARKLFGIVLATALISVVLVAACSEASNSELVGEQVAVGSAIPTAGQSSADVLPPTATATPPSNEFAIIGQPERFLLEDLSLVGIGDWVNSGPLDLEQLADENKVVLLDFWTYTCVNCVRTFPYLNAWHEAYADSGLVVIGIHSPEFEFEKSLTYVEAATDRYGIEYPIALDSDKETWDKYGNHFWSSKYLISSTGEVVLRHFGEGGYDEFDLAIRAGLEQAGNDVSGIPRVEVASPDRSDSAHTVTRELYGGYSSNYLSDGLYVGQDAYYAAPDTVVDYADDGTRRHGQFFLSGQWTNRESSLVAGQPSNESPSHVAFDFFATSVNAVLSAPGETQQVIVEIDGAPVSIDEAGPDISWDSNGNSVLMIGDARLYQIIELPKFGKHELRLKTNSEGLAFYTVTFGVNEFGP
jgi:thiol-disulfide isomerase/thioredoxin